MASYHSDPYDQAMADSGVTINDMNTKAYERIKKALKSRPDIWIGESISDALKEAATMSAALSEQVTNAKLEYISDDNTRNAVAAFNATLKMVKETFGEESMTPEVICKAIEAGSYIGYRSIMGEASTRGWRKIE